MRDGIGSLPVYEGWDWVSACVCGVGLGLCLCVCEDVSGLIELWKSVSLALPIFEGISKAGRKVSTHRDE